MRLCIFRAPAKDRWDTIMQDCTSLDMAGMSSPPHCPSSMKRGSLALLVFVAACPCSPSSPGGAASRGITLDAVLQSPSGTPLGHVFASLEETRGDPWPRSLGVSVSDPVFGVASPLAGHIQHLRLLDSTFNVVQEIETAVGNANTNSILTTTVFFGAAET